MDVRQQAKRLLDLQDLLFQFLEIERKIFLPDGNKKDRLENDTEHSFNLALMAWYLCTYYQHLDRDKVIRYALVHDIVEVHAGDVMAVGRTEEEQKMKDVAEAEAFEKIADEWSDFPDFLQTLEDYEHQRDKEAVFVKALDKIAPMMWQIASKGKTWKKYDISRSVVIALKDEKTAPSEEIAALWQVFREEICTHDEWFNIGKAD